MEKERDDYLEELRNARTQLLRQETNKLLSSLEEPPVSNVPVQRTSVAKQGQSEGPAEGGAKEETGAVS